MPNFQPLQDVAYNHLRDMIDRRELQYGVIYSETKLAAQLGVSRTPMRDALTRLTMERYFDILPNRGFRLHRPDETDLVEAYHVRMMCEKYCGCRVCDRIPNQAPEALAVVERMRTCLQGQRDIVAGVVPYDMRLFWDLDEGFHGAAIEYMNIPTIYRTFENFMHFFMPQHLHETLVPERHLTTLDEHEAILLAIEAGDKTRFKQVVRKHLDSTLDSLMRSIEANSDSDSTN